MLFFYYFLVQLIYFKVNRIFISRRIIIYILIFSRLILNCSNLQVKAGTVELRQIKTVGSSVQDPKRAKILFKFLICQLESCCRPSTLTAPASKGRAVSQLPTIIMSWSLIQVMTALKNIDIGKYKYYYLFSSFVSNIVSIKIHFFTVC